MRAEIDMKERVRDRWALGGVGTALGLLAAATGLRKIRAPDSWWHLSAGRWIVDHGAIPHFDVFTYTVPGAPWIDIHWLFQLGLLGVHALGGETAIVVAKAVLVGLLVAIVATMGWRRERPFVTAAALGGMLLAINERVLARPELTSFVLLAAILALLERHLRRRDAWLYGIVPLQLLWVNTHGLFALGIVLCAIYSAGEAIRVLRGDGSRRALLHLSIVTGLALLASFANPNGIDGALYPLQQLGMITPEANAGAVRFAIGELYPLWHPQVPLRAFVFPLALAVLTAIALVLGFRGAIGREEHALALVAFLGLFVIATRNAALFSIVAAPLLVIHANHALDRRPPGRRARAIANAVTAVLLLAASFDVASGRFYSRIQALHEPGIGVLDLFVARGAADWIERERPPGRIAHSMVFGGYLGWRLLPDYQVMIDGRLEVFGPETVSALSLNGPRAFARLDERYGFGSVVLSPFFDPPGLIAWLNRRPDWQLVYVDTSAVLFVRVDPGREPSWPSVDLADPALLPEHPANSAIAENAYATARERLQAALRIPRL